MPRRYARLKSQKHEVTWSNLSQNASTVQKIPVIKGVEPGDATNATDAVIGNNVRSVYFEFHFNEQETGGVNVIHWAFVKEPFSSNISNPNVYNQTDKRFIMKRGMEMLPPNVSTVFKRVFVVKIPRVYNRVGDTDQYTFQYIASTTQQINACGFAIWKEYS